MLNAQISLTDKDIKEYKHQVEQMINYFQETLNFIGNPDNTAQEKDIIFSESYTKIFRDEHVQIEDDLDEDRGTSINKDVQAYLKDIDFFFQKVNFKYDIQKIEPQTNYQGETFFKVTMMRSMTAKTIEGDSIFNTKKRFMEINLNPMKKDLRIVSLYTTKPNETEELRKWWNKMSDGWKNYFGTHVYVADSIEMIYVKEIQEDNLILEMDTINNITDSIFPYDINKIFPLLKEMTNTTEINVKDDKDIYNLEPLSELSELTYLNCSGTKVNDITPIRNLGKISYLDISDTHITNISNLKYTNGIQNFIANNIYINNISVVSSYSELNTLSIANTDVFDITPLSDCQNLNILNISQTDIDSIDALKNLPNLYNLDISYTPINDLSAIQNAENLHFLNIEGSKVNDLSPLANLQNLNEINFSNTDIADLSPLNNIKSLNRVYCDHTLITRDIAFEFMRINTNALVINETETLENWWESLPSFWKSLLVKQNNANFNPTKEQLHAIINMKELVIDKYVLDLAPITKMTNLQSLDLSSSKITDLSPIYGLYNLKHLNISNTTISDISVLKNNTELTDLNIENTKVQSLASLHGLSKLMNIKAEGSLVTRDEVVNLRKHQRQVKVIYQTDDLRRWWGNISTSWREIFNAHINCNSNPTAEQLQDIVDIQEIVIDPIYVIQDLEALSQMAFLEKLIVNNNQIYDLSPLSDKEFMRILSISGNPVDDISALENMFLLEDLDIENTAVADLTPISNLQNIKVLNIGGTSVKNLKPISDFNKLEDLSIINTAVKNLHPVKDLPSLRHLTAFKTKVPKKDILLLRQNRPELNVIYYD